MDVKQYIALWGSISNSSVWAVAFGINGRPECLVLALIWLALGSALSYAIWRDTPA